MGSFWQDVKYGARMLWKHRLVTLIAALALALGIGVNTATFSVAEAFLLHPVPFDVDRLMALEDSRPQQNVITYGIASATYLDWKAQSRSFEQFAAYAWNQVSLTGDGLPQQVQGFRITANFFDMLNVHPLLGRTFLAEEEQPGKDQVLLLSYGLWERRYAADPNILGKTVKVDGKGFTVVGVMRKGFVYPMSAEAWMPLAMDEKEKTSRDDRHLWVLAKRKPGLSAAEATAEMQTIAQRLGDSFPETNRGWKLRVLGIREFATGDLTRQYTILSLGAVGFVLLIACANVANLQLARAAGRHKELAIRTAMGASRWRIVRQILIESVMLACLGAAGGLLIAQWYLQVILANMPLEVEKYVAGWSTIRLDGGAIAFTLAIAVLSGILSGLAPALMTSRISVSETLKEAGRGTSSGHARHRLRNALVIAEVGLSLILLVGAGLFVKGFRALLNANASSAPRTLLTFRVSLPHSKYEQPSTRLSFFEQTVQRLNNLPEVQSASVVTGLPYENGGGPGLRNFSIENRVGAQAGETRAAIAETISPNYFQAMNIALKTGRLLSAADTQNSVPVTVISESLARRYFSGEDPLGRRIKADKAASPEPWMMIVGVVGDIRYSWFNRDDIPTLYRPLLQAPPFYTSIALRVPGDPLRFAAAARTEVAAVDPELPLFDVMSMERLMSNAVTGLAYVAALMAAFGVIALVLASVGLYGVIAYSVGERTHEIGMRMALGARPGDILQLIVRDGMVLAVLGLIIGFPVAFGLAWALSSLLFGVSATDPAVFVGLPLLLTTIAFVASYIPARRAMHLDPMVALRYE